MTSNPNESPRIDPTPSIKPSGRFGVVAKIVGGVVALGLVIALLLPATRNARGAARRAQCTNNLKHISLAILAYEATFTAFPPAYSVDANGRRLHSWRTLILPYLEKPEKPLKIDLLKPWDDSVNQQPRSAAMYPYMCPSFADDARSDTTYLAVVASDGVFSGAEAGPRKEVHGGSTVVMVVEVSEDRAVNWMSPHDISEQEFLEMLRSDETLAHDGGVNVAFADGRVTFLHVDTTAEELRELISIHNKNRKR